MKHFILFITLLFSLSTYALKPDRNYIALPDSVGINYKEFSIVTPDNYNLKSWVCYPAKPNGDTLVMAYGDAGNMSYWINQAAELVKNGFTVVMFDYRGFGKSSDFSINNDYLYYNEFVIDLATVVKWTKNNVNSKKTGVWALSMGTIMATLSIKTEPVDFLIAEGYVTDPEKIKDSLKSLKNKDILLPDNYELYKSTLAQLEVKILLFAGSQDIITTVADSTYVASLNPANKLIEFTGNHLEGFQTMSSSAYGDGYISKIKAFIK